MNNLMDNNSKEMNAVVETFIIEETKELIYDGEKLEKWNNLVQELGLNGQNKIVAPEKSPVPFMHMKKTLLNIAETLCPRKIDVKEFSITPIPVEILNLIALSHKEHYFNKIEIWYDDEKPDPFCVGMTGYWYEMTFYDDHNKDLKGQEFKTEQALKDAGGKRPSYVTRAHYLIGKWGDVKRSFKELQKMATERYVLEHSITYKEQIKKAQRELDDVELEAAKRFAI